MGITRIEDLVAFQRAVMFKEGIYTLVRATSSAYRDRQWRRQIFDSAMGVDSNSAEGWISRSAAQICQFLDYAHASLDETRRRSSYVLGRMGRTADAREVLRDLEQSSRPIPHQAAQALERGHRLAQARKVAWVLKIEPFPPSCGDKHLSGQRGLARLAGSKQRGDRTAAQV